MEYYTWQNLTWIIFHKITLNCDPKYINKYRVFFNSFKFIIPCSICKNHYCEMLDNNYSFEKNKNNIFNWTIDLHNKVNSNLNKRIWNYNEARTYYNNFFLSPNLIKQFLYDYIKYNFRKGPLKTENLLLMITSVSYLFPRKKLRENLINFNERFILTKDNFKKWIIAFVLLIKKN